MIYNVSRVRRLSTKFQVDTCKGKEVRSTHADLTAHADLKNPNMNFGNDRSHRVGGV